MQSLDRVGRARWPTSRIVALWIVCSLFASAAYYVYSRVSLPAPRVNVRWASGVDDRQRLDLETGFALTDGRFTEHRTWSYALGDAGRSNVAAIVHDPRVEDTHGIDLVTLRVAGLRPWFDGLVPALIAGFVASTLALAAIGIAGGGPASLRGLSSLMSRESRVVSLVCLGATLTIATLVRAPSWRSVGWDDEELWMSVLKTSIEARYVTEGAGIPLWNPLQGFGVPHPSATHLLFSPLFPLMLVLPAGVALALHYSIMTALGVGSTFVLCRRLGASPFMAGVGALTWLSSCFVTQLLFEDFWTQAFTFANFAPALVIVVLNYLERARTGVRARDALLLTLAGGIVLNSTTPAGSVPFAVALAVVAGVFFRANGFKGAAPLALAFAGALAMYAPSAVELWQEVGRFDAVRRYTMTSVYPEMLWTALAWPLSGSVRSAGLGAPFVAAALAAAVLGFRSDRLRTEWRAFAAAAATCLVLYALPSSAFPLASGNGEWGQFLTIFAIPLASAQITVWHRRGGRRFLVLTGVMVLAQLSLIGYWTAHVWSFQRVRRMDVGVGQVLDDRTELERALQERVQPDRDRVLLSPSAEDLLLRSMKFGHAANLPRLGIPLVNGMFKFVSYQSTYPDLDATWGHIQTHGERLRPESIDAAGVSLLVTANGDSPDDSSMRRVGRHRGLGSAAFDVWQNVDAWPRVSFVDGELQQQRNSEAGVALWRRQVLPVRLPDAVNYRMPGPGTYSITFAAATSDRFLMISENVRTDLLTVHGGRLVASGPLADVFTVLKVPAGTSAIEVTWETPLRRWLWRVSWISATTVAVAYFIALRRIDHGDGAEV